MSNYNSLKTIIDAYIKRNGNQEITGQILNSVLNQMVSALGAGYQFAGVATTTTDPGSPDAKVFYIANGKGTYTNFGGIVVNEDEVVVLIWDETWHKQLTGIPAGSVVEDLSTSVTTLESKTEGITKVTYPSGEYETKIDGINIHDLKGTADGAKQKADYLEAWKDVFVSEDFAEVQGNLAGVQGEVADLRNDKADKSELASVEGKAQTAENLANSAGELASQTAGSLATLTSEVNTLVNKTAGINHDPFGTIIDDIPFGEFVSETNYNIDSFGHELSLKADKLTSESSLPEGGFLPNVLYSLGTIAEATTFEFGGNLLATDEYMIEFSTGDTAPTITWGMFGDKALKWLGDEPTINANKTYQVSVMNGLAVIAEF